MSFRPIKEKKSAQPFIEGAGVSLFRAFGFRDPEECDPFLMLDDFRNDDPEKFKAGFPWHPHRGIETITYVLDGTIEHQDSLGNKGTLSGGDVQWSWFRNITSRNAFRKYKRANAWFSTLG